MAVMGSKRHIDGLEEEIIEINLERLIVETYLISAVIRAGVLIDTSVGQLKKYLVQQSFDSLSAWLEFSKET